jgi:hypothetical protein
MARIAPVPRIDVHADFFQLRLFAGERALRRPLLQVEAGGCGDLAQSGFKRRRIHRRAGDEIRASSQCAPQSRRVQPEGDDVGAHRLVERAALNRQAKEIGDAAFAYERRGPICCRARADLLVDTPFLDQGHEDLRAKAIEGEIPDVRLQGVGNLRSSIRPRRDLCRGFDVFSEPFERHHRHLREGGAGRCENQNGGGNRTHHPWPTSKLKVFSDGRID